MSWYDPTSYDAVNSAGSSLKNWFVGGDASSSVDPNLKDGTFLQGYLKDQLGSVNQRAAPQAQAAQLGQAAQLNGGPQDQSRQQQGQLAQLLQRVGSGQQVGAGEMAVNRQMGQATAGQQAMAMMARGANSSLASRLAARNTAGLGVAGAGQAAQAQLNDASAANSQLGGLLGNMRSQDIGFAGDNAQLQQQRMLQQGQFGQQTNLANMQSQIQTRGQNDQASMGYLGQLLGLDQAQLNAQLAHANLSMQDQGHLMQLLQMIGPAITAGASGGLGGGATMGGGGAGGGGGAMTPSSWGATGLSGGGSSGNGLGSGNQLPWY